MIHENSLNVRQYWLDKKALKGRARLRSKNDPLECICDACWDCCIIEAPEPNANEEEFKCNQCTYVTTQRKYLNDHIKVKHDKIKDIKCPSCTHVCGTRKTLNKHMNRHHKKVNCDMCGYECVNALHLKKHMKAHDNVKDNLCPSCPYAAPNKLHLAEHINKYHDKREPVNAENKPREIKISDCHSMADGSHPPYINMVKEAITATNPTEGTSRQAIIKYIRANYSVGHPLSTISKRVSDTLNIHCSMGDLVRATGYGASGSFKLADQRKVRCDLCGYVCNNETHLASHVKVVHKTSDKIVAKLCPPAEPEGPSQKSGLAIPSNNNEKSGKPCDSEAAGKVRVAKRFKFKEIQKKVRVARTSYKHHQLRIMRAHFQINQYPDSEGLKMLSKETNLDKKVLQVSVIIIIIKFWHDL